MRISASTITTRIIKVISKIRRCYTQGEDDKDKEKTIVTNLEEAISTRRRDNRAKDI